MTFLFYLVYRFFPYGIIVNEKGISKTQGNVGTFIPYGEIEKCDVGILEVIGKSYPIIIIKVKDKEKPEVFAVNSKKVDFNELKEYLSDNIAEFNDIIPRQNML